MTQANGKFTPGFGTERFGSDFFPDAIPNPDQLVTDLTNGTSVAVFGLRRIGKSSLLKETGERLRAMGKKVIWVDMDTYDTPSKALAVILHSMHQENKKGLFSKLRYWLDNSKIIPAGLKTKVGALALGASENLTKNYDRKYIEVLSGQTRRILQDQNPDSKPVIIFDELTTLIKKTIDDSKDEETRQVVGRLNSFLGQLRGLRKSEVGVTMAVSGSLSLDWLKEEYGIRSESINDCVDWDVEELDRKGAKNLLEMCVGAANQPNWNDQFTEDLLDFLPSFYPGVVQLAFWTVSTETIPIVTLNDSIRKKIKKALSKFYYKQLNDFFKEYSTSEKDRIRKLFDVLVTKENGIIGVSEALDILNDADSNKDKLDGESIIDRLNSRSFIDILGDEIGFSSGLVSGWHNSKKTKKDN